MSDATDANWGEFAERMNRQFVEALERNVEAQAEFVESFTEAVDPQTASDDALGTDLDADDLEEGVEGYARAYEVWMDAAEQMVERTSDAAAGEDVEPSEFRNVWLDAANSAFKEVMNTTAFAAATGSTVGDALATRREADEAAEDTLRTLGFATEGDVQEVGARLVELERRQQEVENKLDRVLDAVED